MDNAYMLSLSPDDYIRMKVVAALKEKMISSPFNKITVSELCTMTKISRSTFYRLFPDINGVAFWELMRLSKLAIDRHPMTADLVQSFRDQYRLFFEYLLQEKDFFQRLAKEMDHASYGAVYQSSRRYRREWMLEYIRNYSIDGVDKLTEFQVDFVLYGISNVIAAWAAGGMEEDPDTVASYITTCFPERLRTTLQACARAAANSSGVPD